MMNSRLNCLSVFFIPAYLVQASLADDPKDHFVGKVITEWLPDQGAYCTMKLQEEFSYIDPNNKLWKVPAGTIIDGASIPQFLWSFIGSPYTGPYRDASVIHDYYCQRKTRGWREVHRMFYQACLTAGLGQIKAKLMYAGVYAGGPRWENPRQAFVLEGIFFTPIPLKTTFSQDELAATQKWVEETDPSLEEIEERLDQFITEISEY